jgi:hypothetical protein
MALPPPFGSGPDAGLSPDSSLQEKLDARLDASPNKAKIDQACIGLVDLTQINEDPSPGTFTFPFASRTPEKEVAVYSLSKIAAMFAAFHLRDRVSKAAANIGAGAKDVDDLVKQIETEWRPLVSHNVGLGPFGFPKLKRIFKFGLSAPWQPVNFTTSGTTAQALDKSHHDATGGGLGFMDRMKLMIRWSDNPAAGSCAHNISYQYMAGALKADGFADNKRNGILWLGGDFGFGDGDGTAIMGQPPWDRSGTWVRANARGIASFLALLWTNQLVSADASRSMRSDLMLESGVGYATWLSNSTPSKTKAWSKVGANGSQSEAAIIDCSPGGKKIRYAAVVLSTTIPIIQEVAPLLQAAVAAVH